LLIKKAGLAKRHGREFGAALAESGKRILIVDLDPQANATSSFGLQGAEDISLYEPLLGGLQLLKRFCQPDAKGLFIVAGRSRYGRRGGGNRADAKSSDAPC